MPEAAQAELVPLDHGQLSVAPAPVNLLSVIAQAALDPGVDVEKMRALLELKERIDENEAKKLFHAAMIAAQEEMRPVVRNCENKETHSWYANLEAVDRSIRPIYTRHGFVLSFNSEPSSNGMVTMTCTCMHKGGFTKEYKIEAALDDSGIKGSKNKTGVMAAGSTVSYLRRYLSCMIFNVVLTNEDDDGVGATQTISEAQANKILDLLIACEMEGPRSQPFLSFMGVAGVDDIPARDYDKAVTQLQAKLKRMGR
jgi:hypothetical protein